MSRSAINFQRTGFFARTRNLRNRIVRPYTARLCMLAQKRAYQQFAERHPIWAESLFDEHFLHTTAAPLIGRCRRPDGYPIAEEFVLAWWSQFSKRTIGPCELEVALPVAADFLGLLNAELRIISAHAVWHSSRRFWMNT